VSWDPELYMHFARERTQPAIDLAGRVRLEHPCRIMDLGCGPGNSTAILRSRWPNAEITGLDNDIEMISAATGSDPSILWICGDAEKWHQRAAYDLVFSNALLQWLPDHQEVLGCWFDSVAAGGVLAVQIPVNFNSPVHLHILEVASDPRWRDKMVAASRALYAAELADYYDILAPLASHLDVWLTEYCHILGGPEDILTWMRGTGLRPFLNMLHTDADSAAFESDFLVRVTESYPRRNNGKILFPFRRLFFVAYR
jgi:trans-aconitate 2-methyltransferase